MPSAEGILFYLAEGKLLEMIALRKLPRKRVYESYYHNLVKDLNELYKAIARDRKKN